MVGHVEFPAEAKTGGPERRPWTPFGAWVADPNEGSPWVHGRRSCRRGRRAAGDWPKAGQVGHGISLERMAAAGPAPGRSGKTGAVGAQRTLTRRVMSGALVAEGEGRYDRFPCTRPGARERR